MKTTSLKSLKNRQFKDKTISQSSIGKEFGKLNESENATQPIKPVLHKEILSRLLEQVEKIDFREKSELSENSGILSKKHFLICTIEHILDLAKSKNWGICQSHDFIYLYNGAFWRLLDNNELQTFLGEAAEKMGTDKFDARLYSYKDQLLKQFFSSANLPKPESSTDIVLINFKNVTLEISAKKRNFRLPDRKDFLTYQLSFNYDPSARAPLFHSFLNRVVPVVDTQKILAEYLGYCLIKNKVLKLEKFLLLYGTGANGKSVFFDVVLALFGNENVSSYSLQQLTDIERGGSYRAKIGNTLLNYASEINGKLETSVLKAMVSGEPIEARPLYSQPFLLEQYAKLIFNCNELPKDVEHTEAYFRRFKIIPFNVTIPESEQDKELSKKIIESELSGIFNWVLDGLERLLSQKKFTYSEEVENQVENYRKQSDSVQLFLEEENYEKCTSESKPFKELFTFYKIYCNESGYHACGKNKFRERLKNAGFIIERKNFGVIVFVKKVLV